MEMFSVILLFIIFLAAIISIYRKIIFRGVDYKCFFSTDQAFEGDEIEFTEIVTNKKFFPVPWLKSELSLPKYLEFSELQSSVTDQTRFVTSFFSLRSFCRVRRTWKVKCLKRGNFKIESIVISASDILGTVKESFFADTESFRTSVLVMPRCDDYSMRIQGMSSESGDIFMDFGLISDPFFYSGVREYMITDSMKSINWYATAREQKLMVSKNDYTSDISITVILNIQSSHIRKDYPPMSIAFPEWWIEITEESLCIDKTVWLLIQSLADKKQIITQICQKFHITPCLIIRVNSSYENRPEFVLSPRTITFCPQK